MKEIMRFSHYEAEDDSIFSDRDQCKIYETILKNAPAFFSKHFKWQEQVKELSNSIIQMLEGMGFVFSVPKEKVEEISTNYLDEKKG